MVELFSSFVPVPVRIVAQQFDIQAIQPPGGLDIKGVFTDLPYRRNPCQLKEVTEVIGELFELANEWRVI